MGFLKFNFSESSSSEVCMQMDCVAHWKKWNLSTIIFRPITQMNNLTGVHLLDMTLDTPTPTAQLLAIFVQIEVNTVHLAGYAIAVCSRWRHEHSGMKSIKRSISSWNLPGSPPFELIFEHLIPANLLITLLFILSTVCDIIVRDNEPPPPHLSTRHPNNVFQHLSFLFINNMTSWTRRVRYWWWKLGQRKRTPPNWMGIPSISFSSFILSSR